MRDSSLAASGKLPGNLTTKLPAGAALKTTHHAPKAKHVIFLFMSGGVSHVDSFDNKNGEIMGSPFAFTPSGKSGIPVSSMFPEIAKVVDELAIVRSMTTSVSEHAQANFFMHTGFPIMGYPSAGAWTAYGLGTENPDLPSYIVLQSGTAVAPHGGVSLFSNGFLPAQHQGSIIIADKTEAVRNIRPRDPSSVQRQRLDFAHQFDEARDGLSS